MSGLSVADSDCCISLAKHSCNIARALIEWPWLMPMASQGRSIANVSVKGAASVVVAFIETSVKPLSFRKISCKKLNLRGELSAVYPLLVKAAVLETKGTRRGKFGFEQIEMRNTGPPLRPLGMEINRPLVSCAGFFVIAQSCQAIPDVGVIFPTAVTAAPG